VDPSIALLLWFRFPIGCHLSQLCVPFCVVIVGYTIIMPPPLIGGALSDACVWRLSVAYIGPKSRTERPRKTVQRPSSGHKMHQIRFQPGLCPGSRWGSSRRSPDPLVGWGGRHLGRGTPPPSSSPRRRLRRLDSHTLGEFASEVFS